MARTMAFWGAVLLLVVPQFAWALGLGSIELRSALNQPLDAEIPLTSASDEDLASLRVEVAALEVFQRQGLDRPAFLDSLQFVVIRRPDGTPALRVTSTRAAREPFLTFLVEARWARGRVLREYTVLLDPPTFTETPARETPVAAPRTPAVQPDERTGRVAQPSPAPQPGPAARLPSPRLVEDGAYLVQRNDTLFSLARDLRPAADVSINQMMIALFEANPEAFDGNINRLRAGARLAVPSAETLRQLAPAEATARVVTQGRAWREPRAEEPAPRLRLVTPEEASPSGVDPAAAEEVRAEAAALREESSRLREESSRLREETARLRDELDETRRLLELRDTELAELQQQLAGMEDPIFVDNVPAPAPAPALAPASAPGLMAQVIDWLAAPLPWIGLGVVALLGVLIAFLRRRRGADEDEGLWAAAVAEAENLADDQIPSDAPAVASGATAESGVHAQEIADGDPLAQADFHMAYGLYEQAADLVQQALADSPERSDLRLKLVEVYFVWGDQEGFVEAARVLKAQVGHGAEWDKTLIMARQICPDDPLFAGETVSGELEPDFEGSEDTVIYALDSELDLDDLGLDLDELDVGLSEEDLEGAGLGEAVIDLGDADQADATAVAPSPAWVQPKVEQAADVADGLPSATGITQVLDERRFADDFEDDMTPGDEDDFTELGTKLDLARAYIDMGDPEGARSILEEVIEEDDSAYRQEARQLLKTLSD